MLPEWHNVWMCAMWVCVQKPGYWTGVWACVVSEPWLVGDVGISGRLEQWLHNVFALMIPTVCSSYQPRNTGFHNCRWYEITHFPLHSPNSDHPTAPVKKRSDPGRLGKQSLREREREMDMYCGKFIDREGDSGLTLQVHRSISQSAHCSLRQYTDPPESPRSAAQYTHRAAAYYTGSAGWKQR